MQRRRRLQAFNFFVTEGWTLYTLHKAEKQRKPQLATAFVCTPIPMNREREA
jgi:hypothetical protein